MASLGNTLRHALLAAVVGLLPGCGTVTTLDEYVWLPGPRGLFMPTGACTSRFYSGTMLNARAMRFEPFISILDLPLCLVADTIVLPYTIYLQIKHGPYCHGVSPDAPDP